MSVSLSAGAPLRGDEADLFRALQPRLWRAVASRVRAPDALLEDACQHAWLAFLRVQASRPHALAWLVTVAVREACRLAARQQAAPAEPAADDRSVAAAPDTVVEARALLREVARHVPERQRRMRALRALGYSCLEIGAIDGCSQTAVNRHVASARARVRALGEQLAA